MKVMLSIDSNVLIKFLTISEKYSFVTCVARLTLWHCFFWHYMLLVGLLLVWLTRLAFSQPLGLDPGQSHGKSIQVLSNLTSVFYLEAKCFTYDLLAILVLFCSSGIFYIVKIKVSYQELKSYKIYKPNSIQSLNQFFSKLMFDSNQNWPKVSSKWKVTS